MRLKISRNEWKKLDRQLTVLPHRVERRGREAMINASHRLYRQIFEHLGSQGRNGEPPPLSGATHKLYRALGEPDGSGIRNHIEVRHYRDGDRYVAVVGILKGDPTMVAKVQDMGKLIRVSDKMRAFLAAHGIFLKRDTTHIYIPPRRFWRESIRQIRESTRVDLKRFFRVIAS